MPRRKSRRKARKKRRKTRRKTRRQRRHRTRRKRRRRRGGTAALWSVAAELTSKGNALAKTRSKEKAAIGWEKGDGKCYICGNKFGNIFGREHHCRSCGKVVCNKHSKNKQRIYKFPIEMKLKICDICSNKEENAIKNLGGGQKAISALRRAMLENCNSREGCFYRSRNPTPRYFFSRTIFK